MKILKLWRTYKEGFINFYRNGWLSVATITVLTISLYLIGVTLAIGLGANAILRNVQEKVNISVYFNPSVSADRITEIKTELQKFQEIKSVEYVSKEQSLDEFLAMGGDDPSIKQALDEIGENPLLSSLIIRANKPEQYEIINQAINNSNFKEEIGRVNYENNRTVIDRVGKLIKLVERMGITLGVIFMILAVLITFNTIRITIYSHRQEFEVMRLVGASNLYVEMPFVFEGILYGISASIVSILMLLGTSWYISLLSKRIVSSGDAVDWYLQNSGINFWLIFLFLLFSGVLLGVVSSFIAIGRYLKK